MPSLRIKPSVERSSLNHTSDDKYFALVYISRSSSYQDVEESDDGQSVCPTNLTNVDVEIIHGRAADRTNYIVVETRRMDDDGDQQTRGTDELDQSGR